jgi:TM2 domain-containing membrane protein YozV
VATAFFVARHARRRLGTGGMDADAERRILEVAVACKGRVTTTAVAHALSMPLGEADAALTALSRAGYLAIETHPASGMLVYVFPEIDAGLLPSKVPAAGHPAVACSPATALVRPSLADRGLVRVSYKRRDTAALLAILGGSLGAHKFYLGEPLAGLARFVLFWTLLPALAGLCEGLGYLFMSDHAFDVKYNARLA